MTVWGTLEGGLDWQLVQNGFVSAFRQPEALDGASAWLSARGYRIVRLSASGWANEAALHRDFASQLEFPAYYGRNFNALADCLRDVAEAAYGWSEDETGLIIVLDKFDEFVRADPEGAGIVLRILDDTGRTAALYGNRVLCLIDSSDSSIDLKFVEPKRLTWIDSVMVEGYR